MEKTVQNATSPNKAAFFSLINHPLKFKLYLLKNLPAAYFSGLKIIEVNAASCTVSIPFKWFTQKPFSLHVFCLSQHGR